MFLLPTELPPNRVIHTRSQVLVKQEPRGNIVFFVRQPCPPELVHCRLLIRVQLRDAGAFEGDRCIILFKYSGYASGCSDWRNRIYYRNLSLDRDLGQLISPTNTMDLEGL